MPLAYKLQNSEEEPSTFAPISQDRKHLKIEDLLKRELDEFMKNNNGSQPWWKTLGVILGIVGGIITLCGAACAVVYKLAIIEGSVNSNKNSVEIVDKKLEKSVTKIEGSIDSIEGNIDNIKDRVHSIHTETEVIKSQTADIHKKITENDEKKTNNKMNYTLKHGPPTISTSNNKIKKGPAVKSPY